MVKKQDFEALIVRYLEGIATPEEAMQLEDWKNESSNNQKLYDHYEQLFSQQKFQKIDVDAAWNQVKKEIPQKAKIIPLKDRRYWAVTAAAILVVALIIPTLMDNEPIVPIEPNPLSEGQEESNILYAKDGVKSFNLEDNSSVELTKGSSLELSKDFKKGDRRSILKGSGRFTVVHDEKHPFVIDVEGLEVYDIGTVFNITTHKDTVKVVVIEGAVELRKDGQLLAMEEGDSAFYLISQRLIQEYPTEVEKDNLTIGFDEQELQHIVKVISNYFDEPIVIKDEDIKTQLITISFNNAPFAFVVDHLAFTAGLKAVRANNQIEIYDED